MSVQPYHVVVGLVLFNFAWFVGLHLAMWLDDLCARSAAPFVDDYDDAPREDGAC